MIYNDTFKKSSDLTSKVKKLVGDHLGQDLDSIKEDTWGWYNGLTTMDNVFNYFYTPVKKLVAFYIIVIYFSASLEYKIATKYSNF